MNQLVATVPDSRPLDARVVPFVAPDRFHLVVRSDDAEVRVLEVDGVPAIDSALAWERCARRIQEVEFCRCGHAWRAWVTVVGRRIPARRPISIPTALGLARRGHRVSVCPESLIDEGVDDGRLPL